MSRIGFFKNMTTSKPIQDDDALTFSLTGRQISNVNHLVDLGRLVMLTETGEWVAQGDSAGILVPGQINPKQQSYYGSNSLLAPIIIGNSALYVQARGNIIRDLGFDFNVDGYNGNDLTIFSTHLFDDFEFSDWAYQQSPHSILWVARSDGALLGLTYVKEQQIWAWHRHDLDGGLVENMCVIPEGNLDVLYMIVKRTIDGRTVRYIERLTERRISDIVDLTILDSCLSYDGRNTGVVTMTLSGGVTWVYTDLLTITASAAFFTAADIGNAIHFTDPASGDQIRVLIESFTSTTVVKGRAHKTTPVGLRGAATVTWAKAVDELTGLWHLEGEDVSVFADGYVVASPNNLNNNYDILTVTDGMITLDRPYAVIHVGLPITSDLETLDMDQAQGETMADKAKLINEVTLFIEDTRGGWVGTEEPSGDNILDGLKQIKPRSDEDLGDPNALKTGRDTVVVQSTWDKNGRVFVRQVDPIPISLLAIAPSGFIPAGQ